MSESDNFAAIDPLPEGFAAFKALPRDVPINMLNLLRYREQALYPPGHPSADMGWSGRQAYQQYSREAADIFAGLGGKIIWRGAFECMLIGPAGEGWDDAFIASYPNSAAFFAMIKDPAYKQAALHRSAALADSRLLRFAPKNAGDQ